MRVFFLIFMVFGGASALGQDDPFAELRDYVKANCGLECIECVMHGWPHFGLTADGVPLEVAKRQRDASRERDTDTGLYAETINEWRAMIREEMEWCETDEDCDPQSEEMTVWREEQEAIVAEMIGTAREMLTHTLDSNANYTMFAVQESIEVYRQCGELD